MSKLNQRGVIHLLIPIILIIGLIAAVWLVTSGNPLKLFSKAALSQPVGPETSFSLVGPDVCTGGWVCIFEGKPQPQEEFAVKLYARSDIETANLFTAKIAFPKDLIEVTGIKEEPGFIQNWVEDYYDNSTGEIGLTGGVVAPGYQTIRQSALMATITFKAKALGKGTVSFTDASSIYSNLNNIDILTTKRGYDVSVEVAPPPTPSPISAPVTPTPSPTITPRGSRVFVTSTAYDGNLGGLSGADAKCQARADAAKLTGTWKAWLSDSTTSAASRLIHDTGPYKLVNGTVVANGWNDLTDGTLLSPIMLTESGSPISVWVDTNTTVTGGISGGSRSSCLNWTSNRDDALNGVGALHGNSFSAGKSWTDEAIDVWCSSSNHLYCFEQQQTIPGNKGDGNKDGKVNLIDMSVLHTDYLKDKLKGQTLHDGIDMNNDGLINVNDFAMLRQMLQDLKVIRVK